MVAVTEVPAKAAVALPAHEVLDDVASKVLEFSVACSGQPLYDYQTELAYRIIYSIICNGGDELTVLQARQSGKSQTVSIVAVGCMILLPVLANLKRDEEYVFPFLEKFRHGVWIGCFAPTGEQSDTLHNRIGAWYETKGCREVMSDSEIGVGIKGDLRGAEIELTNGSLCRKQTANPRAKIESKTYHIVFIDEAQDILERIITKSIRPMLASTNGTAVMTGTCNRVKSYFYKTIRRNARSDIERRGGNSRHRRLNFRYDWKFCARSNPYYAQFIVGEKARLGEDNDEFQLSYACRWLFTKGMLITEDRMMELGDDRMQRVRNWNQSLCVAGVDPARTDDSTVVTVCWVDWTGADIFGFMEHRILDWLEIHDEEWETQYAQIVRFLSNYSLYAVGVDATGMGGPVAERLAVMMPEVWVHPLPSSPKEQNSRWTYLIELQTRGLWRYPNHSKARRTRSHQRFVQQMLDAEKVYRGGNLMVEAPDEENDDYVDSAALACIMTRIEGGFMPEVESINDFMRHG